MKATPKLLEMIEQLIALPSVSSTQAEIDTSNQPVINCLANWLNDLGFQNEIVTNSDSYIKSVPDQAAVDVTKRFD